ncbi:MAG: hypothetical protein L6R38_003204 [Xanthoria sp. 2 TBL-2021]|nr:MAG: hypothetical protein L6R38_003204 [Xanthoria sp. 2 TBL-2021]
MDGARHTAEKSTERDDDNQDPATRFPAPTLSTPPSPSATSSHGSERSVLDAAARVHPPTPDMDGPDAYIRRRPLLMENEDPRTGPKSEKRSRSHRHRRKLSQLPADGEHQHAAYSSDDGHSSIYSTPSASEDVEMEPLASDDALTDDEETGLTGKDKRKRKRRRTLNTKLDERVAGSTGASPSGWSLADRNVIKASLINILLIASWYLFSVSISVYNKWMFGEKKKQLNFHFPLFTTCMHMAVQFLLASTVLYFFPHFRPRADGITNPGNHPPVHRDQSQSKPLMSRMFYFTRIGPCGTATGLDIGLGNMSFRWVTLTFFTMCKSSALAFILIFAFLFHLEQPSVKLILIIATMTAGVIMMVAGEAEFSPIGFFLIISASFFSGFRWALTQILLLRNPATSNPFSTIFYLAPIMFLVLAILAIPVEGFSALGVGLQILTAEHGTALGIVILLFPGVLAFCMTSSEFALLQRTSVVTLSICGIFKEVVTIGTANVVFHDTLTPINVSGLIVTLGSISAYNYIKIRKMRRQAQEEVEQKLDGQREGEQQPMLPSGGESEIGAQAPPRIEVNGHVDQAVVKKTDERT